MRLRFTLILLTAAALMTSGCSTGTSQVTSISLDFPHGALRVLVRRGQDTYLYYGALPQHEFVQGGTFDIDAFFDLLQTRLHDVAPAEERLIGQPYGMVSFGFNDGSDKDYLIYDEEFAVLVITTACENIVYDADSAGEVFKAACKDIASPTP